MRGGTRWRGRPQGGTYSTRASEAPCTACRRLLVHGWDEGLAVRAEAVRIDLVVADALRALGRAVYVVTEGGWIIRETTDRAGTLRLVRSRHAEHICPRRPAVVAPAHEQLELVDLGSVHPPAHGNGGMW